MSGSVNDPAATAAAAANGGLPVQEASIDVTKLNALSPEVISRQATVSPPQIGAVPIADR
jgi:translation initiation factor 2 subunit 3